MVTTRAIDLKRVDHGNNPAAWTAVGIIIVGTIVVAAAFPLISLGVGVAGVAIIVLGVVVGKVMAMAGFGELPSYEVESPGPTKFEGSTMSDQERAAADDR